MRGTVTSTSIPKFALAHLPTPLVRYAALDRLVGTRVWIKRDDASGGPEAGNKIRKLEYLMAEASELGARAVITCGGLQSNHARATAVAARRIGMRPILLLRTSEPPRGPRHGNLFLDELLGAEIRYVRADEYAERDAHMARIQDECAQAGEPAYVIPEGGSNGLGALGYVDAMGEVRRQLDAQPDDYPLRFDAIVHACGSGGTAAGCMLGARRYDVADEVIAIAVCDDRAYFEQRIDGIVREAKELLRESAASAPLRVLDEYKGPAYGIPTPEQVDFIEQVARCCGLILDPVYTGKALFGLAQLASKPADALFLHTGGLPGLLAETTRFTHPA
jgi:D-cysteine desulfhydrase